MAKKAKMAWSRCDVQIAKTTDGTMQSSLTSVGYIKDKSAVLETSDGETLEMLESGGLVYDREVQDGAATLTIRVIEPTNDLVVTLLGLGTTDDDGATIKIKSLIVDGHYSLKLIPKNTGARGINAPKCSVAYKQGWSESDGHYADITFTFLNGEAGYWFEYYTKQ